MLGKLLCLLLSQRRKPKQKQNFNNSNNIQWNHRIVIIVLRGVAQPFESRPIQIVDNPLGKRTGSALVMPAADPYVPFSKKDMLRSSVLSCSFRRPVCVDHLFSLWRLTRVVQLPRYPCRAGPCMCRTSRDVPLVGSVYRCQIWRNFGFIVFPLTDCRAIIAIS